MTATGCSMTGNRAISNSFGIVYVASGAWNMTNCLVATNTGDAVVMASGAGTFVNCTLAGNAGWGLTNALGAVTGRNNIVWGNTAGGLFNATTTTWSDVQGGVVPGAGNLSADPLFVGNGDYHEQSRGGSWHGGAWTHDAAMSPCIDAGDPADPRGALEPQPNYRNLINMGAYGGTDQASRSLIAGTVLIVQ